MYSIPKTVDAKSMNFYADFSKSDVNAGLVSTVDSGEYTVTTIKDENAAKTLKLEVLGKTYTLSYKESEKVKWKPYTDNIYNDEYGNKYRLNDKNNKITSILYYHNYIDTQPAVGEPSSEIANQILQKMNPDWKYDKMKEEYNESMNCRYYTFIKNLGDYNTSESIFVMLDTSGRLVMYGTTDIGRYEGITLPQFDEKSLQSNAKQFLKEKYKEKYVDSTITNSFLSITSKNILQLNYDVSVKVLYDNKNESTTAKFVIDICKLS